MSGWGYFWCFIMIAALVSYFGLACVITVGGVFDLRKMFSRLNEAHKASQTDQTSEGM